MHMQRRWVCLDIDDRVITCGITTRGKFDMLRMNLTSLGAADWIEGGQKYCEVYTIKGVSYGMHIDEISHGHIRRSRARLASIKKNT